MVSILTDIARYSSLVVLLTAAFILAYVIDHRK